MALHSKKLQKNKCNTFQELKTLLDQQCGKTKGFNKKPFVSQSTPNQTSLSFAGAFCGQLSTNPVASSIAAASSIATNSALVIMSAAI
jgi:hypothetical protein